MDQMQQVKYMQNNNTGEHKMKSGHFRLLLATMQNMLLLRETYFSCFSTAIPSEFCPTFSPLVMRMFDNFGFNGHNQQII